MYSVEFRTTSASSLTDLFIDNEWRGTFTSQRKAQFYVDGLAKSGIVTGEQSGIVSQKNDETPKKRRGRPRKADNVRIHT